MAAAYKIIPGIVKIINITGQLRAYEFSITDLVQNEKTGESKIAETAPPGLHSLQLKNISFRYAGQPILNNLSLSVEKGDLLGITGLSGKGKTTILNLLLGFLAPSAGEILIDDIPVDPGTIKQYWPSISYVRQQSFFIHDTILRNITLEEQGHDNERLQNALQLSGLNEVIAKFPEGLDKVITENGKNISGGQQQRVAIARALYKNGGLILLDEPFNELDEASTGCLLGHFKKLTQAGKIVILITHDKKSLSLCNKIISLDE
jgi:ABC-type bacteriocin/lantibiotic exporter with double-glycine peptidase domain